MAKSYTKEFKINICKLVVEENIKIQIVAKQFNLNQVMIYRWVDEYKTYGNDAFVGKGRLRPEDAKLKKLEQENERLRQENEILKKAAAYLSKVKK